MALFPAPTFTLTRRQHLHHLCGIGDSRSSSHNCDRPEPSAIVHPALRPAGIATARARERAEPAS
jgi:hypothetical protein